MMSSEPSAAAKSMKIMNALKDQISSNMMLVICGILIVVTILYAIYYNLLESRECSALEDMYPTLNPNIRSIDLTDEDFADPDPDEKEVYYGLRDYYIKTAFNCCSGGSYKNDYVSTCALKSVLRQGVRGLDFEVYSIDDQPVVATSTSDEYGYKETFNHVTFSNVMSVLRNYAFSDANAPNPKDPIIMHLRIKSTNQKMYENFAKLFQENEDLLLGSEFANECLQDDGTHGNLGAAPLEPLMGKISIIVDHSNTAYLDCESFCEFINMTSNSAFMQILRYHDIKYAPDMDALIKYNKPFMTIGIPDTGVAPPNSNCVVLMETGCQMIAMRYQLFDTNLEQNELMFDMYGFAFMLKPEPLRFKYTIVPGATNQSVSLSYAQVKSEADYYSFKM